MKLLAKEVLLRHKLPVFMMLLIFFFLCVITSFFVFLTWLDSRNQLVNNFTTLSQYTNTTMAVALSQRSEKEAERVLSRFQMNNEIVYAMVVDNKNKVFSQYGILPQPIERVGQIHRALEKQLHCASSCKYSFIGGYLYLSYPIYGHLDSKSDGQTGELLLIVSLDDSNSTFYNRVILIFVVFVLLLFSGYILAAYLSGVLLRPMDHFFQAVSVSSISQNPTPIAMTSSDEIANIVSIYNRQLQQIQLKDRKISTLQKKAQEAKSFRSTILVTVSHRIRTPVNGILAMAQLLRETQDGAEQEKYLDAIHRSSLSVLGMTNDLLDFSAMTTKQMVLQQSTFDIQEQIEQIIGSMSEEVERKQLSLSCHIDPLYSREMKGDPIRTRLVLINVINNAVKFTHDGAIDISLRVMDEASQLIIAISDTGPGISEEAQQHLFDSFSPENVLQLGKHSATGAGLAISKQLLDSIGGGIQVQSSLGAGATFFITLPMQGLLTHSTPSQPYAEDERQADQSGGAESNIFSLQGRVLLVEDNTVNRQVTSGLLRLIGCEVDYAVNGSDAVEKCRHEHYDLILMDLEMPVMDGVSATQSIRDIEKEKGIEKTPVIAMTEHSIDSDRLQHLKSVMDDYISKPYGKASLLNVLRRWLP